MKLKVTYFPHKLKSAEVEKVIGFSIATKECVWGGRKSKEYLDVFSRNGGFTIRLNFDFQSSNCIKYSHFVLLPRHCYKEPDKVYLKNLDYSENLPIHHETNFGKFKVRDVVYTGEIKSANDRILSMETCESYLIRKELINDMSKEYDGVFPIPVVNYKTGEEVEEWASFKSDSWLKEVNEDETSIIKVDSGSGYKYIERLGLLSADHEYLNDMPDIFKLPQADSRGDSHYVVSQRLFLYWMGKGIKSFWIVPFLDTSSKEYENYLTLWHEVNRVYLPRHSKRLQCSQRRKYERHEIHRRIQNCSH